MEWRSNWCTFRQNDKRICMQHVRDHAGRVPALGPCMQENQTPCMRGMLPQMRASHQMVRDLALQLRHTRRQTRTGTTKSPGTIQRRERKNLSSIQQREERTGEAESHTGCQGPKKTRKDCGRVTVKQFFLRHIFPIKLTHIPPAS